VGDPERRLKGTAVGNVREAIYALLGSLGSRVSWALLRCASSIDRSFPEKALAMVGERAPAALRDFLADKATDLAVSVVMATLDSEGIAHCYGCPQRFGLRKWEGRWACIKHSQQEVKAAAAVR
jgi:hypothetical protein